MTEDAIKILIYALKRGSEMRKAQKEYFKTRAQSALTRSKEAEVAFDTALDNALYAIEYGTGKPIQGSLF